jgi:peptidylprolyl isomerase
MSSESVRKTELGDTVKIHYTFRLVGGGLLEFSFGREPLKFTIGEGKVLSGLEQAVLGMTSSEFKSVMVSADKAFGPYNEDLVYVMNRDQFPENTELEIGQQIQIRQPDGKTMIPVIAHISGSMIVADANHPLAGKDLIIDILLLEILRPDQTNVYEYEHVIHNMQKVGDLDHAINSFQNKIQRSILISVPVFNRKKITTLSLTQTKRYKTSQCYLQVYNDHSTEYDNDFLTQFADEVIQLPNKLGIHKLRFYQFRKFLESDFDCIYMTDNDVIHDPRYITALEALYEIGDRKLPVCIYNTKFHMQQTNILHHSTGIFLKKIVPGVSMFYDRKMVEKIVLIEDKVGHYHDTFGWDYRAIAYLDKPWISSEKSFLEHYGAHGMSNDDFERDRAISPTQYLRDRRAALLSYLIQDIDLQITF